jgi:hydroxyacylglutathione hydrolase
LAHTVTDPPEPFATRGGLTVQALPAASDNLVWVVSRAGRAWIVDGPSAAEVLPHLAARGLVLEGVLLTHGHGDHVGVVHELHRRGLLAGVEVVAPAAAAADLPAPPTRVVSEGDTVEVLGAAVTVWETPGHHPWHVSYLLDDVAFVGDTLFTGGCGRAFHDVAALARSLARLATLPGHTRVCCAHEYTLDNLRFARWALPDDPAVAARLASVEAERAAGRCCVPSTIAVERATNPFLRVAADGFAALRAAKDRAAHR